MQRKPKTCHFSGTLHPPISTLGTFNLAKFHPPPSMLYEGVTFKVGPPGSTRGPRRRMWTDTNGQVPRRETHLLYQQINEDMLAPCWYHDALQAIKTKRIQRSTITNVKNVPRCACKTMLRSRLWSVVES